MHFFKYFRYLNIACAFFPLIAMVRRVVECNYQNNCYDDWWIWIHSDIWWVQDDQSPHYRDGSKLFNIVRFYIIVAEASFCIFWGEETSGLWIIKLFTLTHEILCRILNFNFAVTNFQCLTVSMPFLAILVSPWKFSLISYTYILSFAIFIL